MRHKKSYRKHASRRQWWFIPAAVLSLLIGWYTLTRVVVIRGSILVQDNKHEYELWLDGNPADLAKTDDGWLLKTIPGQHTLTLQNQARQESKLLLKVRGGRTISVTPPQRGSISTDQATLVGSSSFSRLSADGKYLYYLNRDGTTMRRYNIETGANVAISDGVFKSPTQITFSPDDATATMRATSGAWYSFDFRKTDFSSSEFKLLSDKRTVSLAYDPSRFRLGYIKPDQTGGPLAFFTAEADMSGETFETELKDLRSPRLIWAPHGRQIVMLDDASYNESNLHLYDLSLRERRVVPVKNATRAEFSSDGRWLLVEEARGAGRWLLIVDTDNNQAREIGQLRQAWLAAWRPLENTIWACLDGTDPLTITAITTDGNRQAVGDVVDLPGVWQKLIPTAASSDLLISSSFEIWRVPVINQ
jgi:hypothetical protein